MRLVSWNIRAGGGSRAPDIARQLLAWGADIVGLCEFRATLPSLQLAAALHEAGLCYQANTVDLRSPARNSLLLASRWPVRLLKLRLAPKEPGRWLAAEVL